MVIQTLDENERRLLIGCDLSQRPVTSRRIRLLHSAELFLSTFSIGRDCPMLIPLRHENMEGRRWPVVTFALIALNLLIFLGTHWKIEAQEPERIEVRTHVLVLAATHPDLRMPEAVEMFVHEVQSKTTELMWKELASTERKPEDAWEAQIREVEDPEQLQAEMDTLAQRFAEEQKSSVLENYAFVPAHPKPISYLTSVFLHTGWIHLIGNMWFLWLAGFILEDRWGRVIYPIFYILAGIAASLVHTISDPS